LHREITAQDLIGEGFDTQIQDALDFPIQHLVRQTVLGNAVAGDAAQLGHGFEYGNRMAQSAQEVGAADAGRTATDDRHLFAGVGGAGNRHAVAGVHFPVGHEALELVDGNRFVLDAAAAIIFAWMGADPAAGEQQGIAFPDGADGTGIIAFADLIDVLGNIDLGRAGLLARRQRIVQLIEVQQSLAHGPHGQNALGAGPFTSAAPDALASSTTG
jgi:hypothetical protein